MALDGIVIANVVRELSDNLTGGKITRIYQPEKDALTLTVKNNRKNYRLLISAAASLPLVYLCDESGQNPTTAPNFCMVLRKHIAGGRITAVSQPGLERILFFHIEHLDEMGDLSEKILAVELMGRHSNIIFMKPDRTIIDSIKHISINVSSVREVLPGREYFIPQTQHKLDPTQMQEQDFIDKVLAAPLPTGKAIYTGITGISPLIAQELCFRSGIDSGASTSALADAEKIHLARRFSMLMDDVRDGHFTPNIIYQDQEPVEFSSVQLTGRGQLRQENYDSISEVLRIYYAQKNKITRIRQRSADLRHIAGTALDRCRKKLFLQEKQLSDTRKRDKYRIYGEMLNTYGYGLEPGAKVLECINYYDGQPLRVPLDPTLSAHDNSVKYFNRYNKLKRTFEALTVQTQQTQEEIDHLESIQTALDLAEGEDDLAQIREELTAFGYIRRRPGTDRRKKKKAAAKPLHFLSSDGFHIYVGKNNFQNEELTFSLASGSDWWFHAKGVPGSHVIVRTEGKTLPDRTFEEAGRLAAFFSKARGSEKAEVDYVQKKAVKKTPGGRPGFVIYHTNYSMMAAPDITGIRQL